MTLKDYRRQFAPELDQHQLVKLFRQGKLPPNVGRSTKPITARQWSIRNGVDYRTGLRLHREGKLDRCNVLGLGDWHQPRRLEPKWWEIHKNWELLYREMQSVKEALEAPIEVRNALIKYRQSIRTAYRKLNEVRGRIKEVEYALQIGALVLNAHDRKQLREVLDATEPRKRPRENTVRV